MDTSTPVTPPNPPPESSHSLVSATQSTADYLRTGSGSAPSSFMRVELNDSAPTRIGDYTILRILGEGGMGTVYLAEDIRLGRKAAIKTMKPELATPDNRERFIREARAAAAVEHDNIVPIWHVGEAADGSPFIAMPFLQGEMLEARLKREPISPLALLLKVALEVAEGLAAAHAKGLIHRDIKPANVWIEGDPAAGELVRQVRRCKILDFGLARSMGAVDVQLTVSGMILGTPAYMAPEQGRGEAVDHRADLFSLGVMLYRMATGRMPFSGPNVMALLTALATVNPPPARTQNPSVPLALSDLIKHLMKKDRAERLQSAAELASAVRQLVEEQRATKSLPPGLPTSAYVPADGPTADSVSRDRVTATLLGGRPSKVQEQSTAPRRKLTRRTALVVASPLVIGLCLGGWWLRPQKEGPKGGPSAKTNEPPIDRRPVVEKATPPKDDPAPPRPKLVEPKAGATGFTNGLGMEFALVPKGIGWLGGRGGNPGNQRVEIEKDFYLGVYEVTQEEWQKVMGSNPSRVFRLGGRGEGENLSDAAVKRFPVNNVSWFDCREFAKGLNDRLKENGWEYRLPTEAEWEYACRGGPLQDKQDYGFDYYAGEPTDRLSPDQANFSESELRRPCKVGSYPANRLGLHDMHGNVAEWCDDEKVPPAVGGEEARVNRGGSWWENADYCKPTWRSRWVPTTGYVHVGLRMARVPSGTRVTK